MTTPSSSAVAPGRCTTCGSHRIAPASGVQCATTACSCTSNLLICSTRTLSVVLLPTHEFQLNACTQNAIVLCRPRRCALRITGDLCMAAHRRAASGEGAHPVTNHCGPHDSVRVDVPATTGDSSVVQPDNPGAPEWQRVWDVSADCPAETCATQGAQQPFTVRLHWVTIHSVDARINKSKTPVASDAELLCQASARACRHQTEADAYNTHCCDQKHATWGSKGLSLIHI